MGFIYTAFGPDKKPQIHPVPEGASPESVAEQHGLHGSIWEYCESEAEAERRIARDPNGKLDSY